MEYSTNSHGDYSAIKKEIWKVTLILSLLTIIELVFGFWIYAQPTMGEGLKWTLKGLIIILMLSKAFYIVAYFMHLKHELRTFIMTIILPLISFVWIIFAFLYDGNSFKDLRNGFDRHHKAQSKVKAVKPAATHNNTKKQEHGH
ncbi:MAG TPA: cytochrome C oxidase subunit IV family protein [Chitinophagaceae bacterium]|nr:cytochrome C oxidase subunit IV family protein [Chitinophagaceae bacterium]MCC6634768.1 cytochrome C oxidase subunit IV family protein [Chitinophagaceae bacterium]HMZ45494.1 cytochrome C oxidase subunit IV family protein [Chitinophagaceae bacterium]HNE93906.1 cytochrome C oxidase subunit IV family protein [Chitinophagaceae bacterium]HNJ58493.1 cytochrome C oxidase subunit IV family protein [Chitinophagaceae bacterium]